MVNIPCVVLNKCNFNVYHTFLLNEPVNSLLCEEKHEKTKTGSKSGPALFTSSDVIYKISQHRKNQ